MDLPRRDETLRDYQQRILRVLDYIDAHLDEELSLTELARVAAFSPFHFHHVFKGLAGESALELVRRLRLDRAWRKLNGGSAAVAHVGLDSGYSAEESFIRAFKAQFGLTPGEARRQPPPTTDPLAELRLRLLNFNLKWGTVMEHKIVSLPAFRVVGLGLDCPGFKANGIGELWGRFFPRLGEISRPGRILGVSLPHDNGFYYIAGAETPADAALPPGMEEALIPGGEYFSVRFHDAAPKLSSAFSPIFSQMLPAAGREPAAKPICLEDYPPDCHDPEAGTLKCDLLVQLA
jgi:AraC family transcriptional regulator